MKVKEIINEICRLVGILLFWTGLCVFAYYDHVAISTVLASLFILPASFYTVFKSTKVTETFRVIAIIFFLTLPAYGWFRSIIGQPLENKENIAIKQAQAKEQERKELKRFEENRDLIIKGIRHYYEQGNYRFAYAHADEFVFTKDPELMELHEKSKQKLIEAGEYKEP